jgi:hypothetical protein
MKYYVGLDVAMEETAICIVDDHRRVVRESKAASARRRRCDGARLQDRG